jgi:hypothetical protein
MRPCAALLVLGLVLCNVASATDDVLLATPLRDPWLPPQPKRFSLSVPTEGATLKTQVERKLRATFAAADREGRGSITKEQARRAGLGVVANNFALIDAGGTGRVSFDDFRRYLRERGADF